MSLYRLTDVSDLQLAIQAKYLEQTTFSAVDTSIEGRDCLLVSGSIVTESVKWGATLHGLTSLPVTFGNTTAAAVLLIRREADGAWAITFGMGFQLLDQTKVDGGFGQRIAVRTADPNELNSLTRTTLDQRSRTDRFSIPSGDHLRNFGIGDFGELVTRLVGKGRISALSDGQKPMRIRGADALSIPLGKSPGALVKDLDVLESVLAQPAAPELEMLEQLVAVKHDVEKIRQLEGDLSRALLNPSRARIGLSWPHERIEENGVPSSFRLLGAGRSLAGVTDGTPDLEAIISAVNVSSNPTEALKRVKVQLFRDADGQDAMSSAIPAIKWISFETNWEDRRYCLHDGTWYLMDQDYARKLRLRTAEIFERPARIDLPEWPEGDDENTYNNEVADYFGGVCLDGKANFIYTELHRTGIEVCDVLCPDGRLIYVKNIESSKPASHLLAQALVSVDSLMDDEEARVKFREVVEKAGGNVDFVPDPVKVITLGIARKGHIVTADDLFTFTQVSLVRQCQMLQARYGIEVLIAPIARPV